MVGNEETIEKIKKMILEDRIDLDHQPIIGVGGRGRRKQREEEEQKEG